MANKDGDSVKTTVQTVTDFLKHPAEGYAKVKAGERLILTGADGTQEAVIYPGSISDYANE